MVNKLYKVIRKHPKENSPYDISVGNNYYKNGETIGHKIFVQVYGNEVSAQKAIDDMKDSKWIKDFNFKEIEVETAVEDMSKAELMALAKEKNIDVQPAMKKDEIIALIKESEAAQ